MPCPGRRAGEIGLPRIGVHDLRHTAVTIMISSGVPPAVVSKTLRHSTLSTAVNLYGHLPPHAARDAVRARGPRTGARRPRPRAGRSGPGRVSRGAGR
ncbi:tyrosine-type recombinase/integrase [Streptomyces sp. HK10]|uniref:tyrosine-type recombinase/integrase n=1 Tax=Streptomyces sp. HK10 TaxID=3373255 RepID=UPI003748C11C